MRARRSASSAPSTSKAECRRAIALFNKKPKKGIALMQKMCG